MWKDHKPIPNTPGLQLGQFGIGFWSVRDRLTARIDPKPDPEARPKDQKQWEQCLHGQETSAPGTRGPGPPRPNTLATLEEPCVTHFDGEREQQTTTKDDDNDDDDDERRRRRRRRRRRLAQGRNEDQEIGDEDDREHERQRRLPEDDDGKQ